MRKILKFEKISKVISIFLITCLASSCQYMPGNFNNGASGDSSISGDPRQDVDGADNGQSGGDIDMAGNSDFLQSKGDEKISFSAMSFMTNENKDVNNVSLNFSSSYENASYEISRASSSNNSSSNPIYKGNGTFFNDYDLELGDFVYTIKAFSGGKEVGTKQVGVRTYKKPNAKLDVVDNINGTSLHTKSNILAKDGLYYNYNVSVKDGKASVTQQVSKDGYNFDNSNKVVLDEKSHELLSNCKLESQKIAYAKDINKVVLAAHWEKPDGYADGKLLLATATPGEAFKVHMVDNPEGIQVRDMSIFIDDDGSGYLLAAANKPGQGANASIYIFNFKKDFSGTDGVATVLFEDGYHEMPNVVKKDGYYYLFLSQTAGWYPSEGSYASSKSMKEGWSELRTIGNTSTFSSQSSWVVELGNDNSKKNYMMHAYRWIAGDKTSSTMIAPITFDNGTAFYEFYPKVLYNCETGDMIPVSNGKCLTQNCEFSASANPKDGSSFDFAIDGNYRTSYTANSASWPITFNIDLKEKHNLNNIQLSWYMCKGSEGYYMYTIEGSDDNKNWTKLVDNTNEADTKVSKTYGFNVNELQGSARYLRINVKGAKLQNNPDNNWYTPTLYEVKVLGE